MAGLRGDAAVVAERLERRAPASLDARRSDPPSIPSIFMCASTSRRGTLRGPRGCHTPAVPSDPVSFAPPWSLSPSSCSSFKECPLAFRFSYLERLPEPPSPWTSKGTLVHRALELLLDRPADERTLDAALADLAQARVELATDPDFTDLELTDEEWAQFDADAESLVRRYFELEDPRTVQPHRPRAQARGRPRSRPPPRHHRPARARRERRARGHRLQDRLGAVGVLGGEEPGRRAHLRAALRAHARPPPGTRAALYLSKPEAIIATPTDQSIRGVERTTAAMCVGHRRRVRARRLPARTRAPLRLLHLQAVLPRVRRRPRRRAGAARSRHHDRAAAATRRATARRRQLPRRPPIGRVGSLARCSRGSHALDLRIDAWVERIRSPQLDPVFYGLSSAADHGLLWLLVGPAAPRARGRPRDRAAPGRRARRRVGAHERSDQGDVPPGPARRATTRPRDRSRTACAARSPARSRRATPRRRSPPPRSSPAAPPRPLWFALAGAGRVQPGVHADAPRLRHRRRRRARRRAGRGRPAVRPARRDRRSIAPVGYGR